MICILGSLIGDNLVSLISRIVDGSEWPRESRLAHEGGGTIMPTAVVHVGSGDSY